MFFKKSVFNEKKQRLLTRAAIIKAIRQFFDNHNYIEVETPVLQVSPCMDTHIHAFSTEFKGIDLLPKKQLYLHTSPEFGMKKLLTAGCEKIYQICHVFRNADETKLHSPEFTMVEWYNTDHDYKALMHEAIDLIKYCAHSAGVNSFKWNKQEVDIHGEWTILSVREALLKYAKIDIELYLEDENAFKECLKSMELHYAEDDRWDDLFHRVMLEYVEPYLGVDSPCILYDYPAQLASLAQKKKNDPRYVERFEVYICGVELANGFGELVDPQEQEERFYKEMDAKQSLYGERYPVDNEFIEALKQGLPECSGIALGIDRLVMLATGAEHINEVLWHPVECD